MKTSIKSNFTMHLSVLTFDYGTEMPTLTIREITSAFHKIGNNVFYIGDSTKLLTNTELNIKYKNSRLFFFIANGVNTSKQFYTLKCF